MQETGGIHAFSEASVVVPPEFTLKEAEQFRTGAKSREFTPQRWMFDPAWRDSQKNLTIGPFDEPTSSHAVKEDPPFLRHRYQPRQGLNPSTPVGFSA